MNLDYIFLFTHFSERKNLITQYVVALIRFIFTSDYPKITIWNDKNRFHFFYKLNFLIIQGLIENQKKSLSLVLLSIILHQFF
jgi:hypothetical protein